MIELPIGIGKVIFKVNVCEYRNTMACSVLTWKHLRITRIQSHDDKRANLVKPILSLCLSFYLSLHVHVYSF